MKIKIISWLFSILVPFILIMASVRLLISPLFLEFEYRTPGFPDDAYGFTLEERLHWSKIAVDYLLNPADISFLANLMFPDSTPLYNDRELTHMEDVKQLVQLMLMVWVAMIGAGLVFLVWAWRKGNLSMFYKALSNGGKLTFILVLSILVAVALSFYDLFTVFHQLFFEGDTWIFLYSDTLIRLFPMRFWQDAFIGMGIFTLIGASICLLIGWKFTKKYTLPQM